MIQPIDDKKIIAHIQKQFVLLLKKNCDEKITCKIGHMGSSREHNVWYSTKYDMWCAFELLSNRYWNVFGTGKPVGGRNLSIEVEINFPFEGIDLRIGGMMAKEKGNDYLIVHNGRIGGGRSGIGKGLFFEKYRDGFIDLELENKVIEVASITSLKSTGFIKEVASFVHQVAEMKKMSKQPEINNLSAPTFKNFDESFGTTKGSRKKHYVIDRKHGLVVNELRDQLLEKKYTVANDRNRDLLIYKGDKVKILFEVKTTLTTHDIYKAIGQLLFYSIPMKPLPRLVFVHQGTLDNAVIKKLKELGIETLKYTMQNNQPVFQRLAILLKNIE